jgi:hypothetical protein
MRQRAPARPAKRLARRDRLTTRWAPPQRGAAILTEPVVIPPGRTAVRTRHHEAFIPPAEFPVHGPATGLSGARSGGTGSGTNNSRPPPASRRPEPAHVATGSQQISFPSTARNRRFPEASGPAEPRASVRQRYGGSPVASGHADGTMGACNGRRSYPVMTTTLPLACPSPRYRSASGTSFSR